MKYPENNFLPIVLTSMLLIWSWAGSTPGFAQKGNSNTYSSLDNSYKLDKPLIIAKVLKLSTPGITSGAIPTYHYGRVIENMQIRPRGFTVQNDDFFNVTVKEIKITGPDASDFWMLSTGWPMELAPTETAGIVISFAPSSAGLKKAVLHIITNHPRYPILEINLRGMGQSRTSIGKVFASVIPSNTTPVVNEEITVSIQIDMSQLNAEGDNLRHYEAKLSWDSDVLKFIGFAPGSSGWGWPTTIGIDEDPLDDGYLQWYDVRLSGVDGQFKLIDLIFRVTDDSSNSHLKLEFPKLEAEDIETLLPVLTVNNSSISVPKAGLNIRQPIIHKDAQKSCNRTTMVNTIGVKELILPFIKNNQPLPFELTNRNNCGSGVTMDPKEILRKYLDMVLNSKVPTNGPLYVTYDDDSLDYCEAEIDGNDNPYYFNKVLLGKKVTHKFQFKNDGSKLLQVTSFGFDGKHGNQFSFSTESLGLPLLFPGMAWCPEINFVPTSQGTKNAIFYLVTNDPENFRIEIPLTGEGVLSEPGEDSYDSEPVKSANVENVIKKFSHGSHPQPFNPTTMIDFYLEKSSYITVDIYDILGRKVIQLFNGTGNKGLNTVKWNATDRYGRRVQSGYYIYRIKINNQSAFSGKMMLLK